MRIMRFVLIMALVAMIVGYSPQKASAAAFASYSSGIQVQNLENTTATISLNFYDQNGDLNTSVPDTLDPLKSKTWFPIPASGGSFNGSVVISSTTKIASISNILANNGEASGSYIAAAEGSNTLQIPLLMRNNGGYTTWFNVQNTSSSDAIVSIDYTDTVANPDISNVTIKPSASHTFDQGPEGFHTAKDFGAVVTSSQPVVATVMEESGSAKVLFVYNGFTNSGATNPVFPLINANNSGYVTGISLKNGGASATTVTVTYKNSTNGADVCTETQQIPAGGTRIFALLSFAGVLQPSQGTTTCVGGSTFVGGAVVTSNSGGMPLTAVVNQLKGSQNGGAYSSFDPATATSEVVLPLIMDRNGGYYTGFSVMNVSSTPTTISCTFTNSTYVFAPATSLVQYQAVVDLQSGKLGNGYVGSATCTAANPSAKLVAVVNELGSHPSYDQLLVYESINVAP